MTSSFAFFWSCWFATEFWAKTTIALSMLTASSRDFFFKNHDIIHFQIFMIPLWQRFHEKISSYIDLVYGFSMQKLPMVWIDVTVTSILKIGDISTGTFQKPAYYNPDNVKNMSDFDNWLKILMKWINVLTFVLSCRIRRTDSLSDTRTLLSISRIPNY